MVEMLKCIKGSNWYRVYNDRFIEQGGETDIINSSSGHIRNITFLINYTTTSYTVLTSLETTKESSDMDSTDATYIYNKTISGCTINNPDNTPSRSYKWYVFGY